MLVKKMVSTLFAVLLLSSPAFVLSGSAASGDVVYKNDFEDGEIRMDDFGANGKGEIATEGSNHYLKLLKNDNDAGYLHTAFGSAAVADFDWSMRVRLDRFSDEQWNWAKLCFRAPQRSENESYHLELWSTRVAFSAKGGPNARSEEAKIKENTNTGLAKGVWYTVEIFARGDTFSAYINGKKMLEMSDPDFKEGVFVLCSWGVDMSVDNIVVTERAPGDPVVSSAAAPTTTKPVTTTAASTETTVPTDPSAEPESSAAGSETSETVTNTPAGVTTGTDSQPEPGNHTLWIVVAVVILVLAAGGGAVFLLLRRMNKLPEEAPDPNDEDPK